MIIRAVRSFLPIVLSAFPNVDVEFGLPTRHIVQPIPFDHSSDWDSLAPTMARTGVSFALPFRQQCAQLLVPVPFDHSSDWDSLAPIFVRPAPPFVAPVVLPGRGQAGIGICLSLTT